MNHKQVEVGIGWQSPNFYFHDFNRPKGFDLHPAMRIGQNLGVQALRPDEIELEIVAVIIVIDASAGVDSSTVTAIAANAAVLT